MQKKILVVDDTETMRSFSKSLLRGQGYIVETAENGTEALKQFELFNPDLVLLDLTLPDMGGIECCRKIKQNEAARDVKIVMVTSISGYSQIPNAFAAGCDDYVVLPVDRTELMLKVKELLKFSYLHKMWNPQAAQCG